MSDRDDSHGSTVTGSRRWVMRSAVLGGVGSLAGCSALTESGEGEAIDGSTPDVTTTSGPARFERVSVEGPAEATVGETVRFDVSAVNVGGETGDFEGTLGVAAGASEASAPVTVEGVAPGERGETTVEVTFLRADDLVVTVEGTDAEHEVSVGPVVASVGASLDLGEDLRATLVDVRHERALFYAAGRDGERRNLFAPPDGELLTVLRFEVENRTTTGASFGLGSLALPRGGLYAGLPDGLPLGRLEGVEGAPLADETLASGASQRGWLLARVPAAAVRDGFRVGWQRDGTNTRPEKVWTVPGSEPPSFSLDGWALPSSSAPGTVEDGVTVRNDGEGAATFRGAVDSRLDGAGEWTVETTVSGRIGAGETQTFDASYRWPYVQDREFRVRPFDGTRTVDFGAPSLEVGGSLVTPFGSVTVTDAATGDRLVISGANVDAETTVTPDGAKFVFVEVEYARERDVEAPAIPVSRQGNRVLLTDGDTEYTRRGIENFAEFRRPVSGRELNNVRMRGDDIPVGESKRGWVVFDVPAGVSLGGSTFTWQNERNDLTVRGHWTLG